MTGVHHCALCQRSGVPAWRVVCSRCFHRLPKQRQDALSTAWRRRVIEPEKWQDVIAETRQWWRDRRV